MRKPYSGKLRWRGTLEAFLRSCFKASCSGILVEGHAPAAGTRTASKLPRDYGRQHNSCSGENRDHD